MTLNYVTRWFGPQRIHNPLCQRCVVISLVRKTRSQANKRLSCANMTENASKEPRNTAKSPYYWDMMRLLDNARKEGELTDVTLWVEGKTFPAHRCVLAASSQFFQGLFTNDMKEKSASIVNIEGIFGDEWVLVLPLHRRGSNERGECWWSDRARELLTTSSSKKHRLQV